MTPLYIATKKFDPIVSPSDWQTYQTGSKLGHLKEVVSLDSLLCLALLETKSDYWPYVVNEDFMGQFFTDLDFLVKEVAQVECKNILCVCREPTSTPAAPRNGAWDFMGYDLVDVTCGISALTNCGGFPNASDEAELSSCGLLTSLDRAREVQLKLKQAYAEEPHAYCHVWAVYRSAA